MLFNDRRLSADGTVSCATCHQVELAFTDGLAVAEGVGKQKGTRNTPSILNAVYSTPLFWDGRRATLEEQAGDPFVNPVEHGLGDHNEILRSVRADPSYISGFRKAFGVAADAIRMNHVSEAIAAFERSLLAGDSPFDRYEYGRDPNALSPAAVRGLALFRDRAGCEKCHTIGPEAALFTDNQFHSLGVGFKRVSPRLAEITRYVADNNGRELDEAVLTRAEFSELGRFVVTLDPVDIGRFKTPSLRNVAVTAPYMHDGSINTLEEALNLEIYYRGVASGRPLILTPKEKAELIEFLKALTSPQFEQSSRAVP